MAAESGRKAVAGGKVEKGLAEKWEMQERMQNQAEQDAYAVYEEDEANIQNLLSRGMISDEEARRLRTRAKMHMDDQQKKHEMPIISSQAMAGAGFVSTSELLAQALAPKRKNYCLDWWRRTLGIECVEMAVAKERRRRMELDFTPPFPFLVVMIHDDMTFELVMISLVAANALLTGVQISFSGTDNNSEIYDILEYTFTGAFVVEIILRVTWRSQEEPLSFPESIFQAILAVAATIVRRTSMSWSVIHHMFLGTLL